MTVHRAVVQPLRGPYCSLLKVILTMTIIYDYISTAITTQSRFMDDIILIETTVV